LKSEKIQKLRGERPRSLLSSAVLMPALARQALWKWSITAVDLEQSFPEKCLRVFFRGHAAVQSFRTLTTDVAAIGL